MKTSNILKLVLILFISYTITEAQSSREKTETLQVKPGGDLSVSLNPGDVSIRTWNKNEVHVSVRGIDREDWDDFEIKKKGETVIVSYNSAWGWSGDVDATITIPEKFNVDISTTGGNINFRGDITGSVDINTSGGDISTDNIFGNAALHTSGGDISIKDVSGALNLNTMGGDITVGKVKGDEVSINTMGGDISVLSSESSIDVKTYGGDIEIGDVGGSAEATTYGGDVEIRSANGNVDMETYGGDIELGKTTGDVRAKTQGGDIILYEIKGSVNAKTQAGKIYAEMDPQNGSRSSILRSSSGEIEVVIMPGAKATIEAEIRVRGYGKFGNNKYDIISDYPHEKYTKSDDAQTINATYKINGGGPVVTIKSVNSDIIISKDIKTSKRRNK